MGVLGVNIWYTHFIIVELNLPILGVENLVSVLDLLGDTEPHLFKFWYAEDVRNPFLVDPTINGIEAFPLVSGCGPCFAIPKQQHFPCPKVCREIFVVHLIVC